MRGFIRQRGTAWELRVFVGTDAVTHDSSVAQRFRRLSSAGQASQRSTPNARTKDSL